MDWATLLGVFVTVVRGEVSAWFGSRAFIAVSCNAAVCSMFVIILLHELSLFCLFMYVNNDESALTLLVGWQSGHPAGCWFVGGDDLTRALHIL